MPKVVDHDARRGEILDSCFRLMAEEGYAAATMRRIASAAGVSTGTLYHYFPDKEAILAALFDRLIARDAARVRSRLPEGADMPTRLHVVYAFVRSEGDYLRDVLRLALEVHRHEPAQTGRAQLVHAVRRYREALAETLGAEGHLAVVAFSFTLGVLAHGLLDPDAVDLDVEEGLALAAWSELLGQEG